MASPSSSSSSIRRRILLRGFVFLSIAVARDVWKAEATPSSSSPLSSSSSPLSFKNHLDILRGSSQSSDAGRGGRSGSLHNRFFAIRHGQSKANVASIIASNPTTATVQYGLSEEGIAQAKRAGERLVRDFLEERRSKSKQHNNSNDCDVNNMSKPPIGIVVVTSDFSRARQTANALVQAVRDHNDGLPEQYIPLYCYNNNNNALEKDTKSNGKSSNTLKAPFALSSISSSSFTSPSIDVRLRERWFGEWDGKADVHYQDVWKEDATDPYHTQKDVESVWSVVDRATALVCDWDERINANFNTHVNENENENLNGNADYDDGGCLWVICVAHGDVLQILQTAFCHNTMDPSEHRSLEHLETATMRPFQLN